MSTSPPSDHVQMDRRAFLRATVATVIPLGAAHARETRDWPEILGRARGQTVYWNAWAGDERTNSFIAWAGQEARRRFGITVIHVRLRDTAEAVARVLAEKQAGRTDGGTVDLIWINGPNFLAMKTNALLFGPFVESLPNWRFVDTERKRSNIVDFTVPVDGLAAPWRLAQVVFIYDSARTRREDLPATMADMIAFAKRNVGRLTHPHARNFLGTTFLKQALYELVPDVAVLQAPAGDHYAATVAPLWTWYDALRPHLWRQGRAFPETGPAMRQMLADGEIDLMISFNPAEAAVSIASKLLPSTTRVHTLQRGSIGNTSFVAIPANAANKEGAMVIANLLLEPSVQAFAQDSRQLGALTVLDIARLPPEDRARFAISSDDPALPHLDGLGAPQPEPHPTWMTRLVADWEQRVLI